MGKVFDVIKKRRSIRKYENKEVPEEKIMKVLEAANWAPSNGNSQPWKFVIVEGESRKKICKIFNDFAKEYIPNATYIPKEKKEKMLEYSKDFGGALTHIAVAYETYDDKIKTEEALMAACASIQNLCLAAVEEDLGTVWIAGEILHNPKTKDVLGLDDNYEIAGIIPIGFSAIDPPVPPREDPKLKEKVSRVK